MSMQSQVENQFKIVWKDITEKVTLKELENAPILHRWWPTISRVDPDWNVLVENFMGLGANPVAALLHAYATGMAHALEGVDDESLLPLAKLGATPVPDWLTNQILEDIINKYGDEHYVKEKV